MLYQRISLATQANVGEPAELPLVFRGSMSDADLARVGELVPPELSEYADAGFIPYTPEPTPATRWLNKVYVIARIPVQKQAAILLASTPGSPTYDIEVHVVFFQLTQSNDIDLDGDLLVNGTALLVSKNLLTAEDVTAIRADP